MNRKKISLSLGCIAALAGICLLTPSCGNNGCEETRESYLYTQLTATSGMTLNTLYAWGIGQQGGTGYVYDTIEVVTADTTYDSIAVSTVVVDSLMLSESSPTSLELILDPDTTYTEIRLEGWVDDNGDEYIYNDTLRIWYESYAYFLDMECGCSMYFTIHDAQITQHLFKNIILKKTEVTNDETTNLILQY